MPESLLNIKARTLTCVNCRYDIESAEAVPKCPRCSRSMVVVLYSSRTLVREPKVRITGELGMFPWNTQQ